MTRRTACHFFPLGDRTTARLATVLGLLLVTSAWAGQETIVTRVNGQPIYERQIQRELDKLSASREIAPEARADLRQAALDQLIDRARVLQWLQRKEHAASDREVQLAVDELKARLQRREIPLQRYLAERHLVEEDLDQVLRWQISWNRYLKRFLTDDNLATYFETHRPHFDGSRIRIRHILLRVEASAEAEYVEERRQAAQQLRGKIESDALEFAAAARLHSEAPTADVGGELGWIERQQPMPEAFSQAAFQLKLGEVSQPVRSPFGLHLIQCLEIDPGQLTWQEVRQPLELAITRYLFDWIADQAAP